MKNKILLLLIIFTFLIAQANAVDYYTQKDILDAKTQAFALYNTSNSDQAFAILKEIPYDELTEDMHIVMSNIYIDKNDYNSAYNHLNRALQLNPKSYKAYYNLGLIALKKNDNKLAVENFEKSAKCNDSFAWSYYNAGICMLMDKNYKKAKSYFIRAINVSPEKDFYYNLAYTYKQLGKEKNAKKILDIYNKIH